MPAGNTATQSDLAQSMIRANEVDGGGSLAGIYRKNFEAAHVPIDQGLRGETDARVKEAMASPQTAASSELREAGAGQRVQTGPQVAGIELADQ